MKKTILAAVAVMALSPLAAQAQDNMFNGAYGGVQAGYGKITFEGTQLAGPVDGSDNSATAGLVLGVRGQLVEDMPLVLGIEGDVDYYTNGSDWRYGIYGTVGFGVNDNGLLFARVGYTDHTSNRSDTLDGLVLGGGYEHAYSDRLSFRLGYNYIRYGDTNVTDDTVDYTGHEVKAGILFRF